jgi:peroxiredoxin 2/4
MFNVLHVGHKAPNFKMKGVSNKEIIEYELHNSNKKWVVLFFYPADFSTICPTEVISFNNLYPKFKQQNCELIGCSTDSPLTHNAWIETLGGIDFPILSDSHHTTSIDYNVYVEEDAQSLRGTFIIDPQGVLRWYQISDNMVARNCDEVLRILQALQTEKECLAHWKPD